MSVIGVGERNIEVEFPATDSNDGAFCLEIAGDPRLFLAVADQRVHAHLV